LSGAGRELHSFPTRRSSDLVVVQIGALAATAASQGARLNHVKAHGALYNMAVRQPALARSIAQAVHDVDPSLVFYALASSDMARSEEHTSELQSRENLVCRL